MELRPYEIIEKIKEQLLNNAFLDLPDYPTENDLAPYHKIILSYRAKLLAELVSVFESLIGNKDAVNFIDDNIDIEDLNAQGVTKWTFLFILIVNSNSYKLNIWCLIFQNEIQCFLQEDTNGSRELIQKEKISKGIQMLLSNKSTGCPVPLRILPQ